MRKNINKKATIPKKCCYMERECTPACVAYSTTNELSEVTKQIGMSEMHCMRLLMELIEKMGMMGSDDFYDEKEFENEAWVFG